MLSEEGVFDDELTKDFVEILINPLPAVRRENGREMDVHKNGMHHNRIFLLENESR